MAQGKKFTKTTFGIKTGLETTPNTYQAPTDALCLEKGKGSLGLPEYEYYECNYMSESDGDTFKVLLDPDGSKITISNDIAFPINPVGTVDTMFLAGGLKKEAVNGAWKYTPNSESAVRASLDAIKLRKTYNIKGGFFKNTLIMNPSTMVRLKWDFVGSLANDIVELDAAAPNNPIPSLKLKPAEIAWVRNKCSLLINGEKVWVSDAELDFGMELTTAKDYCGLISRVKDRKSTLKVTFKNTEENETPIKDLKVAESYNIVLKLQNITGASEITITAPNAIVSADDIKDVDGFEETTRTFALNSVVKDDNFSIEMTV